MEGVRGLCDNEVRAARLRGGTNALTQRERTTFWRKYTEKFNEPIIKILMVALGVNIVFTFFGKVEWVECLGILISIMISTLVGALSEYKNEEGFRKIQEEARSLRCKVYRNGVLREISGNEIVQGDLVLLQAGDMIPADGRVFSGEIRVDQSALNGETKEALKTAVDKNGAVADGGHTDFWDTGSLFRGGVVCSGQCIMQVTSVGDSTVYGKLNRDAQTDSRPSPLQVKLGVLAKKISYFGYVGAALVTILCMAERIMPQIGGDISRLGEYFSNAVQVMSDFVSSIIVGITVIVIAVPEGLPLMIAIVCSLNMRKMMKSNVLVRKLIGIETAGSINILFSDKTGTITCGRLKVTSFTDGSGRTVTSTGELSAEVKRLLYISATQNSAARYSGDKILGGNATEKALLEYVRPFAVRGLNISRREEVLFTSEKKFSATKVAGDFGGTLLKGAPERILNKCTGYYDNKGQWQPLKQKSALIAAVDEMAKRSIRVLALAVAKELDAEKIPDGLTLVGLLGIRDDLRAGVGASVEEMRRAGIQTVMITGDKKETAMAIAKEAGIWNGADDLVLTSEELSKMTDAQLARVLPRLRVVARAMPSDKSRLVGIAQSCGMVAGMTGDGVNDLPALKKSDVGFAMGSGTDVAKDAGDIVILDDNFSSIKKAVLYGRTIYNSIKKFITFQMTINIAAVSVSILGPIIGIDRPLGIVQMLWVNLCMDTFAAIAFGGEGALSRYMLEKPRRRDEDIIDKRMWGAIAVGGLFIAAVSTFMFISKDMHYAFRTSPGDAVFYTGYFSYFVFSCIFNAFNARVEGIDLTEHLSLNKPFLLIILLICVVQILMTYFGGAMLGTAGLSAREWATVIVMALLIIPVDILRKLITGIR